MKNFQCECGCVRFELLHLENFVILDEDDIKRKIEEHKKSENQTWSTQLYGCDFYDVIEDGQVVAPKCTVESSESYRDMTRRCLQCGKLYEIVYAGNVVTEAEKCEPQNK